MLHAGGGNMSATLQQAQVRNQTLSGVNQVNSLMQDTHCVFIHDFPACKHSLSSH